MGKGHLLWSGGYSILITLTISLIQPFGYICCYKYRYYPSEQWINFLRLLVFLLPVLGLLRGEKKVRRNCMYFLIYFIGISQKILSPGPVGSLLMMHLMFTWATDSVYLKEWRWSGKTQVFLKHVENKVKPLVGKTKCQKRKILLLGGSYPRTPGQWICRVHLLIMWLRAWGRLVITLRSEIVLL